MRLLHGHIFKNGGTTFEGILSKTFGSGHLIVKDEKRMHRERSSYLSKLIREKSFQALSTHFLPVQDALADPENYVVIFLRDPIERALSVYEFEKEQKHDSLGAINAKKMNVKEYFEWRLSSVSPPIIRDYQIRYLLQSNKIDELDMDDLTAAFKNTHNLFIGVVEAFHDSILRLQALLHERGIVISDNYEKRNENRKTTNWTKQDKCEHLREMIGDELYQRLVECNRNDLALYERVA